MGLQSANTGGGALAGIRVLDLSRVVAGPYGAQILGDLGADVVKVERRGEGDDCRRVGPPWMKNADGSDNTEESTYFQSVNRNKRSITVDYARPEGAQLVRDLAAQSDVFIENYRPGTLEKYGLGYKRLRQLNPRLIYCSLTGFGQTGSYAPRSGYDYLVQAMVGVMSVTGMRDGEPGAAPTRVGIPIADIVTGLFSAIGVLGALHHRHETGKGQYVDVSLFDSQLGVMLNTFSAWFNAGVALGRTGNDHPSAAPYGVFPVDDGHLLIATFNDREFVRLARALGHPEWADDPRFFKMSARVANREPLKQAVAAALRGRTKAEWVAILNENTVSCGPINEMGDLELDPHVAERALVIEQQHPVLGIVRTAASPVRLSESPPTYRLAPPLLGEHNDEVLREWLGLEPDRVDALKRNGAI
ncbi:caiB/BaiF family protein (plasmid) [Azospirillum sp. B510]|uniref:CaiB/BaiF CoA transferase family protein n=1 Tax=Azospirillum sp. (strain B510) TaxID=137722 RepID=UPI0001C4CC14|nr:CoA transferase [Azospirillum sp. B510]BAI74874.1 caiB/BaiF family protein [Azospirillum sp. B510]